MASDKVFVADEIKRLVRAMDPDDRQRVNGVFARLEDDLWRDATKIDFDKVHDDQLWGVVHDMINVTFIEGEDGRISIIHVSARSQFRQTY